MKLSHTLTVVGIGASAIAVFVAAQGCSSSTPPGGPTGTVGAPPAKPSAGPTTSTAEHNFALHVLLLGDKDRNSVSSTGAWKAYGYNIDGKVSTKTSTDVCALVAGADKGVQVDGNNGIDNSFGENILPIIQTTAGTDASSKINASITQGKFTVMIDTTGLDDANPTQTATGLKGFLNAGSNFDPDGGTQPPTTWDKTLNWPVSPELLSDTTNPRSSKVQFGDAFVVNGTYVNGTPSDLTLNLSIGGVSLDIAIHQATITFDHTGAGKALNGTIAGVIKSSELIEKLRTVAGRISPSLCGGQAFDSIAQQINQASDIMANGTNQPGATCDGISIGLGFVADEIAPPSRVAPPPSPGADPCADAGTPPVDAGGD